MGKSRTPAPPNYVEAAQATAQGNWANAQNATNANRYGESGPAGSVNWTLRPGADASNPQPGDFVRSTELSADQQQLFDTSTGVGQQLGDLSADLVADYQPDGLARQSLQDALYRRGTQYYDQNFGDQEKDLRSRLLNSGLAEGSEAYQRDMRNFGQRRDLAYADATDRAVIGAEQQSQSNQSAAMQRLMSAVQGARGGIVMPTSSNDARMPVVGAADQLGATNQQYQAQVGGVNARNAATSNTIGSVAGAAALFF